MAGIYLHIPFCRKACHYCNFYFITQHRDLDRLVPLLLTEARLAQPEWGNTKVQSIYLGGGTPSLLAPEALYQLLNGLSQLFGAHEGIEVTLEANPEDVSGPGLLSQWKQIGVNRVSLGIQSMDPEVLGSMNRAHSAQQALQALKWVSRAGFDSFSCDLIYGIPRQSEQKLEAMLNLFMENEVPHISAYALTVEPKTALDHFIRQKKYPPVSEEQGARELEQIRSLLLAQGFIHYEVSNFARPGHEARHNSSYWEMKPYLGLGPAAHGFWKGYRYSNPPSWIQWKRAMEHGQLCRMYEERAPQDPANELIMTGLRRNTGIRKKLWCQHTSIPWEELVQRARSEAPEYVEVEADHIRLKPAGIHWADGISSALFFSSRDVPDKSG